MKQNLKFFRDKELNFGVGLRKNRSVRINKGKYVRIDSLNIPDDGLIVELKSLGKVKVFKRVFKKRMRPRVAVRRKGTRTKHEANHYYA